MKNKFPSIRILKHYIFMFYNCPVTTYFLSLYRSYEGVIRLVTSQRTCTKLLHMSTWWNLGVAFSLHNMPTRRGEYSLCLKKKRKNPSPHASYTPFLRPWRAEMILQGPCGESKGVLTLCPWKTIQGCGTAIILTTVMTTARIDWEITIWHTLFGKFPVS